jgi:DNA-binding MarR family transcriptional regulator
MEDDRAGVESGPEQLPAPEDLLAMPGYVVRRMYHAYVASWQRHVDSQLTGPQFAVLTAIQAYPGAEQGSLARAVALDRPTMSAIAKRLEDRELITRARTPDDGRKRLLYLTESGTATLSEAQDRVRTLERRLMRHVGTPAEAALLAWLIGIARDWESVDDDLGTS